MRRGGFDGPPASRHSATTKASEPDPMTWPASAGAIIRELITDILARLLEWVTRDRRDTSHLQLFLHRGVGAAAARPGGGGDRQQHPSQARDASLGAPGIEPLAARLGTAWISFSRARVDGPAADSVPVLLPGDILADVPGLFPQRIRFQR